jgi:hypothetical protein
MNNKLRCQWDTINESRTIVNTLGRDTRIVHVRTKRKMLLVRDMLLLTHEIFLRDETIISLSFSINNKKCPPIRGVPRMNCSFYCWILRPIRDSENTSLHKTHVTLLSHIDPRGRTGNLGKGYFYNIFGSKPIQNLRTFIHQQNSKKGYCRIRQSMYDLYARQNREETIHGDSVENEGFYHEVRHMSPKWDKDPVSKLICPKLRYRCMKRSPRSNAKNRTNQMAKPNEMRKVKMQSIGELRPNAREATPTGSNLSTHGMETSSTAGNTIEVLTPVKELVLV